MFACPSIRVRISTVVNAISVWLLAPLLMAPQEKPTPDEIRGLVEELRSESVEARSRAYERLKRIGPPAVAELGKVVRSSDVEVAAQARRLLRVIAIHGRFTPGFLAKHPGIGEDLVSGKLHVATVIFLGLAKDRKGGNPPAGVDRGDLEALAADAVRGAKTSKEKRDMCDAVGDLKFRAAAPAALSLLSNEGSRVRVNAAYTLGELEARELIPDVIKLLDSRNEDVRSYAILALRYLEAKGAAPRIRGLLKDASSAVRKQAVKTLQERLK